MARPRRASGAIVALALVVTVLYAAVAVGDPEPRSSAAGAHAAQAAPQCAVKRRTGRFEVALKVDGERRTALVNVPPRADGRAALPVMFALHGAGGWAEFMESYSGLTSEANRAGFIAVYPNASAKFWNLTGVGEEGNDDLAFVRSLLDRVERTSCVDPARVYVTGVSNGAGLTARVGCELSDRVAAIAPVSGGYYRLPPCGPDRPVSVLEVHGTADRSVPYGGKYGEGSVSSFLAQWRRFDGCSRLVARSHAAAHVLRSEWTGCASGSRVAHLEILGGTHTWQGSRAGGDSYIRLSTQRQVVAFFRGKQLAGRPR